MSEEDDKPPSDKPGEKLPEIGQVIKTSAEHVTEQIILRLKNEDDGEPTVVQVSSRDIAKILSEKPDIVEKFRKAYCFDFYDLVRVSICIKGKMERFDDLVMMSYSPVYFLKKGMAVFLAEIEDNNEELHFFRDLMIQHNRRACFVARSARNTMVSFFNPDNGYKMMDLSEILALASAPTATAPADSEGEPDTTEPDAPEPEEKPESEDKDEEPAGNSDDKKPILN